MIINTLAILQEEKEDKEQTWVPQLPKQVKVTLQTWPWLHWCFMPTGTGDHSEPYWNLPESTMLTQIVLPLLFIQVATSSQTLYELRYETTSTTGEDGSVILTCRDSVTADELKVQNVSFWLNRSSEYNQDLRERGYFGTIEPIGCCSIRFSLQQRHEGYYTCGRSSRNDGVHESPPKILICKSSMKIH